MHHIQIFACHFARAAQTGLLALFLVVTGATTSSASCCQQGTLQTEAFATLADWHPFSLPGVADTSLFTVDDNAQEGKLQVYSKGSGSGIIWKPLLDMNTVDALCWQVKVMRPLAGANIQKRSTDDSPLRLALLYARERSSLETLVPSLMGASSILQGLTNDNGGVTMLVYTAVQKQTEATPLPSPFSGRIKVIPWQAGKEGQWRKYAVIPRKDYLGAFAEVPPRWARLALISDTDNTGGEAAVIVDNLSFCRR